MCIFPETCSKRAWRALRKATRRRLWRGVGASRKQAAGGCRNRVSGKLATRRKCTWCPSARTKRRWPRRPFSRRPSRATSCCCTTATWPPRSGPRPWSGPLSRFSQRRIQISEWSLLLIAQGLQCHLYKRVSFIKLLGMGFFAVFFR
jgi:hypothetical protein